MKTKLRLFSLLLAMIFVLLALAGCAEKGNDPAQTPEAASQESVRAGNVRGKVLSGNGDMMIAGIIIVDEENNAYRATTNAYGGYHLELAPGKYTITFTKGFEFDTYTTTVEVESLKTYYLRDVRLNQLTDSYASGWIAGDLHQHSTYSDGADSIANLAIANASAGIYWGFLTDHNSSRGVPEWRETSSVNVLTEVTGAKRTFFGMAVTLDLMSKLGGVSYEEYFVNWAKVWCMKARPEYLALQLSVDVHAPAVLRANMQPRNFEEWYTTFGVKKSDKMYIAPSKRVVIW